MNLNKKHHYATVIEKYTMIFLGVLSLTFSYYVDNYSILFSYGIVLNVLIIYIVRNSTPLQIIFVFMLTYLLNLIPYFYLGINIAYFTAYQQRDIFQIVLILQVIFLIFIYMFINKDINKEKETLSNKLYVKNNIVLFFISIFAMVFIFMFGKKGENIFESSGYQKDTLESGSGLAINEYFLIFVLMSYLFSGNNEKRKALILIISIVYAIKNILYGGRIETLQLLILLLILFFDKYVNKFFLLIAIISGYFFLNLIANFRNSLSTQQLFNFLKVGKDGSYYFQSNQGDVFYTSSVYIGLIKDKVFDMDFRIQSFFSFIQRIFMPSQYSGVEANLSNYSKMFTDSGGGGLISTYFYVWLSYFGIFFIGVLIAYIVNRLYKTKNQLALTYFCMVLATTPRWFAYDPITMFKLSFYSIVVHILFSKVHVMMNYRNLYKDLSIGKEEKIWNR